jgi:hypothetical protein
MYQPLGVRAGTSDHYKVAKQYHVDSSPVNKGEATRLTAWYSQQLFVSSSRHMHTQQRGPQTFFLITSPAKGLVAPAQGFCEAVTPAIQGTTMVE